jgi:hypothetical protein
MSSPVINRARGIACALDDLPLRAHIPIHYSQLHTSIMGKLSIDQLKLEGKRALIR